MSHIIHVLIDGRRRLAAGAAAAGLAVVASIFAWSASFAAPAARTDTLIIPWKVTFQLHQSAPPAVSWGDTLQANYIVAGAKPGTADFVCTAVATHFVCQGIIRLPDGDIYTMTGPVDPTQPAAIVGGTRAFVGVTGEFTQRENGNDTGTWFLKLRRPQPDDR